MTKSESNAFDAAADQIRSILEAIDDSRRDAIASGAELRGELERLRVENQSLRNQLDAMIERDAAHHLTANADDLDLLDITTRRGD